MSHAPDRRYELLLVDDNPAFLDVLADLLSSVEDRFVIETTTSGRDAFDRIRDDPVDCVVASYELSGMDGLELFAAVGATAPDVRFVLMSDTRRLPGGASVEEVDAHYHKTRAVNCYPEMGSQIRTMLNRATAD